jgi:hypothetical protein
MREEPKEEQHEQTDWLDTSEPFNVLTVTMENGEVLFVHSTSQERWDGYGRHSVRNPLQHFMQRCDRYMGRSAPCVVNFESVDGGPEQLINIRNIQHVTVCKGEDNAGGCKT